MRRRHEKRILKTNVLKIDKDCHVSPELNLEYVRTILQTCRKYEPKVLWVKSSRSRHGMHFYIKIKPALEPHVANNLQYLLGDDAKRVAFNRARIESGSDEWNKLFERANARLTTVYRNYYIRSAGSDIEIQRYRAPTE
ncbi:hypothetical protein D4R54_00165 [archaeon]|nr:MAG: hypothetical protein D4R54_00165 [archaeon]